MPAGVWYQWTTTASTATTAANIVWDYWNDATATNTTGAYETTAGTATLRLEQEAAVAKAEMLLREHLTEVQVSEYDRLKSFLVEAQSGRVYRIRKGWSGNVELLNDKDEAVMRFCIHPSVSCPDQDNMLAQKLLLETNEDAFNSIANKTPLRHREAVAV